MADDPNNTEISNKMETSSLENEIKPGKRMKALRDVMSKTISSYTNNLRLIKRLNNVDSKILKQLEKDTVSQLKGNIQTELEQMFEEEQVEPLLNNLDTLADHTPSHNTAWRPCGDVRNDSVAHLAALNREKLKVLQGQLSELEAQNRLMVHKVGKREEHLFRTKDKIINCTHDFKQTLMEENALIKSLSGR
ncbi:uncharacterized protein LOC128228569 [Mya arenaria]|uniref:uncharacterized protein LOC128228569 n=1 Tax=Mya arenaria TaxID=6604 RepID=UPI0022E7C5F4|nr:uncharacterized protein LOC128228569 [Mya arenaria]